MRGQKEGPRPWRGATAQARVSGGDDNGQSSRQQSAEGARRKAEALATLQARRELYVLRGRRALLNALLRDGIATADAVRAEVELPSGLDPKLFGAVPGELARAGIIARDGFALTERPEGHARPLTRWRLISRAAAVQWLADHPDRPDPFAERSELTLFDVTAPTGHGGGEPDRGR